MITIKHKLLSKGIYAIINKQLNMVYVGQTQRNFLIRWIEHLMQIPNFENDPKRIHLYLNKDTEFIVLKEMNESGFSKKDFRRFERIAQEFYINKDWDVISRVRYNPNLEYERKLPSENRMDRYRKAIKYMSYVLSAVNTKHSNSSVLLHNVYKKVEKHFSADFQNRDGKNTLHKLNLEELEFIMLELYPRFYHKRLDTLRDKYKHVKLPKTLFDFIE